MCMKYEKKALNWVWYLKHDQAEHQRTAMTLRFDLSQCFGTPV